MPRDEQSAPRYPQWSCAACGPHDQSGPTWCAAGCGSDYQRMFLTDHPYTVEGWLVGAENPPCIICGYGRQHHDKEPSRAR